MLYGVQVTIKARRMALNVFAAFLSCFRSILCFLARCVFILLAILTATLACKAILRLSVVCVNLLAAEPEESSTVLVANFLHVFQVFVIIFSVSKSGCFISISLIVLFTVSYHLNTGFSCWIIGAIG